MASFSKQSLLLCAFLFYIVALVGASATEPPTYLRHQRRALESSPIYKRQNYSSYDLLQAQKLVTDAVAQQGVYNSHRVDNPQRNTYVSRHSEEASKKKRDDAPVAPTLNSTLLAAVVLLAEHAAAAKYANGTLHSIYEQPQTLERFDDHSGKKRATSDYWVSAITHTGLASMGSDSSYTVYRDVTNPIFAGGAKGDGLTDDTAAINAAIAYDSNCGADCLSSSTKGTLIYFPPGTYLISTPINAYYYSQLVGDPNDLPIIKTSEQFIGLGAIQSDVYVPNGDSGEWYIEQSNFYRQVRNFIIDIRDTTTAKAAGLHWQIAQATSLTNVYIYASTAADTTQMGMFTENGSGGFMSDCFFLGGKYGLYGGNQQYTVRAFEFSSQTTSGVCLIWDWGWTWQGLTFAGGTPVGITLINPDAPTGQQAGSVYIMDSLFDGVATAILANAPQSTILETSIITLDNIGFKNVDTVLSFADGDYLSIPVADINFVIVGNIEADGSAYGTYTIAAQQPPPSLTDRTYSFYRDSYFVKSRPQYADIDVGSIINVKDHGALGNGVHDDTAAIVAALALATTSNLIYFPAGSYIITSTIVIPPNTRMTGEVWSQLVASGSHFTNAAAPQPMVQVGVVGDVGTVEISDIIFTSIGALPGLVLVEWNVAAETPGSVGMWDAHFRVGGAYGTELQVAQCPKLEAIQTGCIAATMMMHITPQSNGYFENVWAWVADHDIDDAENTQITVAVARGILIESADGPTWFYGTASEHSMLYQYNFYNTANSFAGMIQTESPYFQYTTATESPGPFSSSLGLFSNDPIFPDSTCTATDLLCSFSWAVMVEEVVNLTIAGAGLYSWFDNYDQSVCVDAQNCQQRLINNAGSNVGLYIWNLVTVGAVEMVSDTLNDEVIYAKNNTQAIAHPFWSALGAYLDDYEADDDSMCADDDTSSACMPTSLCDYSLTFDTLDDLEAMSSNYETMCTEFYALGVLSNMLTEDLANYSTVNSGYDSVFDDYVKYTKEMIPGVLQNFMAGASLTNPSGGPGNKYFTCTLTGDGSPQTQQCPFPFLGLFDLGAYTMTYTLNDANGFYNDLSTNYNINQSWVTFGNTSLPIPCGTTSGDGNQLGKRATCGYQKQVGIPKLASSITVSNPKDIITNALPTIGSLQDTILSRQMSVASGQWLGPIDDVNQVLSMPVFMIGQALDSMAQVKAIGEEAKKEEKIHLILEILGIVFIFLPFVDEFAPELDALDGLATAISEAGNVAMTIESIIADPVSAPMDILGLLAVGGGRTEDDMASLAATRRGISVDNLAKIGTEFASKESQFQKIITSCKA